MKENKQIGAVVWSLLQQPVCIPWLQEQTPCSGNSIYLEPGGNSIQQE